MISNTLQTTVLHGNRSSQLCLGIEGPESGGQGLDSKVDGFKEMISRIKEAYPNASTFATTLREVVSANSHMWGAILHENDNWHVIKPREIGICDRIGGGDGFVGGMLYGLLKGWAPEKWAQFGWANGAFTATILSDYSQPADEDQIWSIWEGNARVKR